MKKVGFLLFAVFILAANNCLSQPTLTPTKVPTSNRPQLEDKSAVLTASDRKNHQIYFLIQDSLWTFNLERQTWEFEDVIHFNDRQPSDFQMGYDSTKNVLLFWEVSVGRVYHWKPGMEKPKRIDRSFTHRNQYNHGGLVHPPTGDIYAVGGYGLWTWKNYITRFKQEGIEWSLESASPKSPKPSPRTISIIDYWNRNNSIYILGVHAPSKGYIDYGYIDRVERQDLWKYDIKKKRWDSLGSIQLADIIPYNRRTPGMIESINDESRSTINQHTGDWYIPIRDPKGTDLALLNINLKKPGGHLIRSIQGDFTNTHRLISVAFDSIHNQLLLFTYLSYSKGEVAKPVEVLSIPSSELKQTFLKQSNILSTPGPIQVPWSTLLWYVFGGIMLSAIGYLIYENRRVKSRISQEKTPLQAFRIDAKNRHIYAYGKDVTDHFRDKELDLLILLAKHQQNESPFVATDKIEQALWSDQPNPDYIRRMRNKTIQSINEKVKDFDGNELSQDLIIGRKSPKDKRKMQYGLNEEVAVTKV